MSYDLMVFEKTKAPQKRKEFIDWYTKNTEWAEDHDYDNPAVSSPALQHWYEEMIKTFPNIDAVDVLDEKSESYLTEYSIGYDIIYAAFSWSVAEEAYEKMKTLAQKYGVGFYDVSGDDGQGEILLPDGTQIE